MSGNPTEQVKEVLTAAASTSGEWAQNNVVNPIRSYLVTEKSSETGAFYTLSGLGPFLVGAVHDNTTNGYLLVLIF
jgi:hypothetical protein